MLLVFDVETGGLDPEKHSILSLTATVVDEWLETTDTFNCLICESPMLVEAEALKYNNMDMLKVAGEGLEPIECVLDFEFFLAKHFKGRVNLCGYNPVLDVGFLKRLYRLGVGDYEERFSHRLLDVRSVVSYLRLCGKHTINENATLSGVCDYFGIQADWHTAAGDTEATINLLRKLVTL